MTEKKFDILQRLNFNPISQEFLSKMPKININLKQKNAQLKKQTEKYKSLIDRCKKKFLKFEADIKTLEQENAKLKQDSIEYEADIKTLEEKNAQVNESYLELAGNGPCMELLIKTLEQENSQLKNRVEELENAQVQVFESDDEEEEEDAQVQLFESDDEEEDEAEAVVNFDIDFEKHTEEWGEVYYLWNSQHKFDFDFTEHPETALSKIVELRKQLTNAQSNVKQLDAQFKAQNGKDISGVVITQQGLFKLNDYVQIHYAKKPSEIGRITIIGKKTATLTQFKDGFIRCGYKKNYDKLTICDDQEAAKKLMNQQVIDWSETMMRQIKKRNTTQIIKILKKFSGLKPRDYFINTKQLNTTAKDGDFQIVDVNSVQYIHKIEDLLRGDYIDVKKNLKYYFKFSHNISNRRTRMTDEEKQAYKDEEKAYNDGTIDDINFNLQEVYAKKRFLQAQEKRLKKLHK